MSQENVLVLEISTGSHYAAVEGEAGDFELHDLYDGLRTEVLDVRDLGERVAVVYVIQGRARASGLVFDGGQELAQVATLRDGMITSMRDYFNRREALEAVGLP